MDPDPEKFRPLLAGLLDGELSAEEAAEVNDAMIKSAELRERNTIASASPTKSCGTSPPSNPETKSPDDYGEAPTTA